VVTELKRMQQRTDTGANWTAEDPVLLVGEHGYDETAGREKIGDGTSLWSELEYVIGIPADLDPAVTALAADPDSDLGTELRATYAVVHEAPLSPARYGAVLDGTTDDTTAWQDTFNALPAAGGAIYLDAPSKVTAMVTAPTPFVLRGAGVDRSKITFTDVGLNQNCIEAAASVDIDGIDISMDTPLTVETAQKAVNLQAGGPGDHVTLRNFRSRGFNFGLYASGDYTTNALLDYVHVSDVDIQVSNEPGPPTGSGDPIGACLGVNYAQLFTVQNALIDNNDTGDHGIYTIACLSVDIAPSVRVKNCPYYGVKLATNVYTTRTAFDRWRVCADIQDTAVGIVAIPDSTNFRLGSLIFDAQVRGCDDAVGGAHAAVLALLNATARVEHVRVSGHVQDVQAAGVKIDGSSGAVVRSLHADQLFVRDFSKSASGTYSGLITGPGLTTEQALVGVYDADGATTGRNGINFDSVTSASISPTYTHRNCVVADAFPSNGSYPVNADTSGAVLAALEAEVNQLKALLRTRTMLAP
jgi:hypothetical protein